MPRTQMKPAWYMTDAAFDWLYPERVQQLSLRHWTPLEIAIKAARFLAEPGAKVLDVGSGIGKFVLLGAHYYPHTIFCGVEQRQELHHYAQAARAYTGLQNAELIHANFTRIDLDAYDHFYFYNAFYENLDVKDRIDHQLAYSVSLYHYYSRYLCKALEDKPPGTRLVTYHSQEIEVPASYRMTDASSDLLLKMWIKRS